MTRWNPEPVENRFWRRVNKTATCWFWIGGKNSRGYGVCRDKDQKSIYAHRMSWIMTYGEIPPGMFVCHHCDVPACIRPDHLFIGTNFDNVQDMLKKGRQGYTGLKGSKNPHARLTENQVREIWNSYTELMPSRGTKMTAQKILAEKYGVSPQIIFRIVRGKSWKHIT